MLTKFFEEWNNALKSETIKKTQSDEKGNIIRQTSVIGFRGTLIQIHRKAVGDGTYTAELFVPSTNKFISNKKFTSKAKCAEAILMALIPGTEKEDVRTARTERRAEEMRKKIIAERIETLRTVNMIREDFEWFCALLNQNLQAGRSYYDGVLVDVLTKWYPAISGSESFVKTLSRKDASLHVERMFEMIAMILEKKEHSKSHGKRIALSNYDAAKLFRSVPDPNVQLPVGILTVKQVFREIDEYLDGNIQKLLYVVQVLEKYYQLKTQLTSKQILVAAADRRARAKEKKLRNIEGYENHGTITVLSVGTERNKDRKTTKKPHPKKDQCQEQPTDDRPGMVSVASAIGNALDGLILTEEVSQDK